MINFFYFQRKRNGPMTSNNVSEVEARFSKKSSEGMSHSDLVDVDYDFDDELVRRFFDAVDLYLLLFLWMRDKLATDSS